MAGYISRKGDYTPTGPISTTTTTTTSADYPDTITYYGKALCTEKDGNWNCDIEVAGSWEDSMIH